MVSKDDWRLRSQQRYLQGATFHWQRFIPSTETSDHNHCEFCWRKFMANSSPDVDLEGYSTADSYHWVCQQCFEDFREMFEWKLVG